MIKTKSTRSLSIYIIAGESSGDFLGAMLIDNLQYLASNISFNGIGGPLMIDKGFESLFPIDDLNIMGLTEVLPRVPLVLRRINETIKHIIKLRPDIVITIDSPDFSFRVVKQLKHTNSYLVHYVAPTVWAWRPKRAKKIAKIYHQLLTLFPFEPTYFEKEGLPATFVGHPLIESDLDTGNSEAFYKRNNIPRHAKIICFLPGSRYSEISKLLPIFVKALTRLRETWPDLYIVIPTVESLKPTILSMITGISNIHVVSKYEHKKDAYAASIAAVAASGTVTLELAIAKVPAIITYRVNPITAFIARRLLKIKHVSLINILINSNIFPELLQDKCKAETIAEELKQLVLDKSRYNTQLSYYEKALQQLTPISGSPSHQAAKTIINLLTKDW